MLQGHRIRLPPRRLNLIEPLLLRRRRRLLGCGGWLGVRQREQRNPNDLSVRRHAGHSGGRRLPRGRRESTRARRDETQDGQRPAERKGSQVVRNSPATAISFSLYPCTNAIGSAPSPAEEEGAVIAAASAVSLPSGALASLTPVTVAAVVSLTGFDLDWTLPFPGALSCG
jgi:hypothetical protein